MSVAPPDLDARSWTRQFARLSVVAAFLCCTLNCVFGQLERGLPRIGPYAGVVHWSSLLVVLLGIVLGAAGVAGGVRRKSLDTSLIAGIGLALNLGIVFVIAWYFAVVRRA